MARIRHIALTTKDPEKTAAFYMQAFDMKEVSRSPNGSLHLTDGYIDLAILNWKTEQDADVGPNGPNYNGIHHLGFQVDDMEDATHKLEAAQGQQINQRPGVEAGPRSTTPQGLRTTRQGRRDRRIVSVECRGFLCSAVLYAAWPSLLWSLV